MKLKKQKFDILKKDLAEFRDQLRVKQRELEDLLAEVQTLMDPVTRSRELLEETIDSLSEVV